MPDEGNPQLSGQGQNRMPGLSGHWAKCRLPDKRAQGLHLVEYPASAASQFLHLLP